MTQKRLDPCPGQAPQQRCTVLAIDSDVFVEDIRSSWETGASERQCDGKYGVDDGKNDRARRSLSLIQE